MKECEKPLMILRGVQGSDQRAGPEGVGARGADGGGDREAEERLRGEGAGPQGGAGTGRIPGHTDPT